MSLIALSSTTAKHVLMMLYMAMLTQRTHNEWMQCEAVATSCHQFNSFVQFETLTPTIIRNRTLRLNAAYCKPCRRQSHSQVEVLRVRPAIDNKMNVCHSCFLNAYKLRHQTDTHTHTHTCRSLFNVTSTNTSNKHTRGPLRTPGG
jgi:hypothetical protein